MNIEIIEVVGSGGTEGFYSNISFTIKVTEPKSGETNTGRATIYLSEELEIPNDEELIDLVSASIEYQRLIPQVEGPLWVHATNLADPVPPPPVVQPTLSEYKMLWYTSVDNLVARICTKFTRFQMGYEAREAAAISYRDNGYEGTPTIWITRFADNTGMNYPAAADRILEQAALFRNSLMELENLRMDKYLILQAPNLEAAKTEYDVIVAACMNIDRVLT